MANPQGLYNMARNIEDVLRDLGRHKNEGSMLDEIRRWPVKETMPKIASKYVDLFRNNIPRAKQFIFDENSSEIMASFIMDSPELLFKNQQFAIPHFDVSYYEFDADLFLQVFGRPQTAKGDDRDWRVGYLVVDNIAFVMSKSFKNANKNSHMPGVLLYAIQIGPSKLKHQIIPMSRRMAGKIMLGSTFEDLSMEMRNSVVEQYQFINISEGIDPEVLRGTMPDGAGDLRNLITMILFLYQNQKVIKINEIPPSRGFIKGKQVAYMSKNVVTIHLNQVKQIRKYILANKRPSPKAHWCKPFYRTTGGSLQCDHVWEQYKEERWKCEKCEAKRARVLSYQKGDATKGYVTKHYEVTD